MLSAIPLVFIHGFKGSTLVDPGNWTYYLNVWQALGLSSPQLALPLEWRGIYLDLIREKYVNITAQNTLLHDDKMLWSSL
jgi:CDP-diacylglycerol pyrophosphatase